MGLCSVPPAVAVLDTDHTLSRVVNYTSVFYIRVAVLPVLVIFSKLNPLTIVKYLHGWYFEGRI